MEPELNVTGTIMAELTIESNDECSVRFVKFCIVLLGYEVSVSRQEAHF